MSMWAESEWKYLSLHTALIILNGVLLFCGDGLSGFFKWSGCFLLDCIEGSFRRIRKEFKDSTFKRQTTRMRKDDQIKRYQRA